MAYTKYSLTPSSNTAAPPDGAPEGMLPSAVNDTMRDMMAQIRDCGDGIRDGTYTMTAPKITGGTITGAAFTGNTFTSPVISGGTINNATIGATTATTGKFTTLEATGVATFSAGAVGTPAITTTGDTNTGIFFPAADTIAFTEGGAEAMRIDSSGNVGIGTSSPSTRLTINAAYTSSRGQISIVGASDEAGLSFYTDSTFNGIVNFSNSSGYLGTVSNTPLFFSTNNAERMRITSSGNVGIGVSAPLSKFHVRQTTAGGTDSSNCVAQFTLGDGSTYSDGILFVKNAGNRGNRGNADGSPLLSLQFNNASGLIFDKDGNLLVGKSAVDVAVSGFQAEPTGTTAITRASAVCLIVNRNTDDGTLVSLRQANAEEGNISVSGSTVSYNGGHLSRWSQLPDGSKDESIVKGTIMSNLDDMCVWEKDGVVAENEQLNKMKVSDVEGDTNVAGVFVNWTKDEQYGVDDMNVAMTGDMIIRIADGVVVQKGDLLMSAGDGTAKPQGDDIVRSKTVAKVTSNHVTCTYADGSYCVPCVLMAC